MVRRLQQRWRAALVTLTVSVGIGALAQLPVVKAFHPPAPLPSYEVATIKLADPDKPFAGTTLRRYIAEAYGVPMPWGVPGTHYEGVQVLGGPDWIDKDRYDIKGKPSDELRERMRKMSLDDRRAEEEMLEQSLLTERFHLKVHFEVHEMTVFELVPAKGGLKITPVEAPLEGDVQKPSKPGELRPGTMSLSIGNNGVNILNARSMPLEIFANALRGQAPEVGGRPIVDMTGFKGNFDLKDFRFVGLAYTQGPPGATATETDAPSLQQALEQQLGIKLVRTRAQVEVVVIDSVDRPTEN